MKKTIFLVFALTFLSFEGFSQESGNRSKEYHLSLEKQLAGVYQIQMVGVRFKPAVDTDLLERIKAEQKDDQQVVFNYNDHMRIVILSKNEVKAGNLFSPDDKILYTTH